MPSRFLCGQEAIREEIKACISNGWSCRKELPSLHYHDVICRHEHTKEDVMLEKHFESRQRIQEIRNSSGGRLLESFTEELHQMGYAELTVRRHMRAAEHMMHWICQHGLTVENLNERCIESFYRHLCHCQCSHFGKSGRKQLRRGVRQFSNFLRHTDVITDTSDCGTV